MMSQCISGHTSYTSSVYRTGLDIRWFNSLLYKLYKDVINDLRNSDLALHKHCDERHVSLGSALTRKHLCHSVQLNKELMLYTCAYNNYMKSFL